MFFKIVKQLGIHDPMVAEKGILFFELLCWAFTTRNVGGMGIQSFLFAI